MYIEFILEPFLFRHQLLLEREEISFPVVPTVKEVERVKEIAGEIVPFLELEDVDIHFDGQYIIIRGYTDNPDIEAHIVDIVEENAADLWMESDISFPFRGREYEVDFTIIDVIST